MKSNIYCLQITEFVLRMMNYPGGLTLAQEGMLSVTTVTWFLLHLTAIYGRLRFSVGSDHSKEKHI
jgi:hypothetical protein